MQPSHRAPGKDAEGSVRKLTLPPFEREREKGFQGLFRAIMLDYLSCKPAANALASRLRPARLAKRGELAGRSPSDPPRSGRPSTGITKERMALNRRVGRKQEEGTIGHSSDCRYDERARADMSFAVRVPFPEWMPFVMLGAGNSIHPGNGLP